MSFRFRILLTICLLFGGCLAITIASYYHWISAHEHDKAIQQITVNTDRIFDDINRFIEERNRDMAAMATARIWLDGTPRAQIATRLNDYRLLQQSFDRLCVLDAHNQIIADSTDQTTAPPPLTMLLSGTTLGDHNGYTLSSATPAALVFHQQIRNPAGEVAGTLIGVIQVARISTLIRGFDGDAVPGTQIEMIATDGRLIFANSATPLTGSTIADWPRLSASMTGMQTAGQRHLQRDTDQQLEIIAVAPATGNEQIVPWMLRVTIDKKTLFADAVAWAREMTLFGLICLMLSILLVWFIASGLSKPMEVLIRQIRRLEQGDFSALQQLPPRHDEFGVLTESFRTMAGRLEKSLAEAKRNEQRWQFALEGPGAGMWDWQLRSGEVYFSPQWQQLLGYRPGEIRGVIEEWRERVHDNDRPVCEENLRGYLLTQHTAHFQCQQRIRCKDGNHRWFAVNGVVWERDPLGQPTRLIGTLTDINDRKLLEQEHERESLLNAAFSTLATGLLAAGSINEVCEMVYRESLRLTESPCGYVGHIDERSGHLISPTLSRDIWEQCQVADKEVIFRDFRGLWGWVLTNRQPLLSNDPNNDPRSTGVPAGHLKIDRFLSVPVCLGSVLVGQIAVANASRDYTPRDLDLLKRLAIIFSLGISQQKANQAIQASEEKFRHVVEMTPNAIIIHRDEQVIFANDAATRLLGASTRAELLGSPLAKIVSPELYRQFNEQIAQSRLTRQPATLQEARLARMDGGGVDVETTSVAVVLQGKPAILTIASDIGERKFAEEQLRQAMLTADTANQAKSHFLAVMSHEIRTPMNGIVGLSQLLGTTTLTLEQQEYLAGIQCSAELLLRLIDDILDLSRIEAGKVELDQGAVAIRQLCREVVGLHLPKARGKGLQLRLEVADTVPETTCCDPLRLKQILTNLLANAVKFTDHGAVDVTITADAGPEQEQIRLRVAVADSGIGMDAETCTRIFQSFSQADPSTSRKYGGSGLGLAISKRLVELMGGDIRVDSQPGRGSCFHVTLPMRRLAALPPDTQTTTAFTAASIDVSWPAKKPHVLLVEDNDNNRRVMNLFLNKLGITHQEAVDGESALRLLEETANAFDVVLMDLEMPVMDGFTTIRAIRTQEEQQGGHLPIIALTAHAIKGDREKALDAGFDGYLTKPVRLPILLEELRRISN